ncbi:MAG: hypothetical protein Q9188_006071 [Gyalolechia gomerana]
MLPSPSSTQENLSKLVSLAVKDVLPPPSSASNGIEEGEVREQMIEVTLDAGTKIEGSGNVVVYRKGEELDGGVEREGEKGRKKRAGSEPIDVLRAANAKRARS